MYTQLLSQLPTIQNIGSESASMTNSSTPTSNLFAQMLSQLTDKSTSTTQASQVLGLTQSLSNPSNNLSLAQLLPSNNSLSSLLGASPLMDESQLLGSLEENSTSENTLFNPMNANSYYYTGQSPVFTPASLYNNSNFSLGKLTTEKAGSTIVSNNSNYDSIIKKAAQTYGLPEKLIQSVIKQESNFNAGATSSAGAGGLMQLMPGTASYLGVSNVYDAEQNIMGGTKYLKQMYDKFNGSFPLMLAAYNAGPGAVIKHGGIPPYKETMNYVTNIMNTYKA